MEDQLIWLMDPEATAKPIRSGHTNGDGWYALAQVGVGDYEARVVSWTHEDRRERVRIDGETRKDWVVRCGLSLEGFVTDFGGQPIDGLMVSASTLDPQLGATHHTHTGPTGSFRFAGLEAGTFVLRVNVPEILRNAGLVAVEFGDFQAGTQGVVLSVPNPAGNGTLVVRCSERGSGKPIRRFVVNALYEHANVPLNKSFLSQPPKFPRNVGVDGIGPLELPEGLYTLAIVSEGFEDEYIHGVQVKYGSESEVSVPLVSAVR